QKNYYCKASLHLCRNMNPDPAVVKRIPAMPAYLRKSYAFPIMLRTESRLRRRFLTMFRISRDNPAYLLTSVAHRRLPIFQSPAIAAEVCAAFDRARATGNFLIFAYVIMPDHTHVITDPSRKMSDILRYLNGVSARFVLKYLNVSGYEPSLAKLRVQERDRGHKHSVYEHHPNGFRITGEESLWQKVNYLHLNPVRAGLVEHPDDYRYSSSRLWHRREIEG